jgi:hypothetical protein
MWVWLLIGIIRMGRVRRIGGVRGIRGIRRRIGMVRISLRSLIRKRS